MKYTEPRFTRDLDLWISTDEENARAVFAALKEFGAPLKDLTPRDFAEKGYFYQMGNPPFRLDIMMSIPGVEFESAWVHHEEVRLGEFVIPRREIEKSISPYESGAKVIVLPTIPFGVNAGQLDIKLTINMNPSTQFAILRDVVASLEKQGLSKACDFQQPWW
jgi:hypothetical protein